MIRNDLIIINVHSYVLKVNVLNTIYIFFQNRNRVDNDYEGWVVVEAEQDPAKANPFEYAVKARKYIAENTGL